MFHCAISLWRALVFSLLLSGLCVVYATPRHSDHGSSGYNSGYEPEKQHAINPPENPSRSEPAPFSPPHSSAAVTNALEDLRDALETMQSEYFSLWLGMWTYAIDWTSAVMANHVSAVLSSLSNSVAYTMPGSFDKARKLDVEAQRVENEINKYFGHSVAFFFGEQAFAIRQQAYDDMLWVVLGWLDSIRFTEEHSERHYPSPNLESHERSEWHGRQFAPVFAHRARIFYELAEEGWDWHLCGGGMLWNPRLQPYKNAITNELFISASIAMYLHFPGDDNCSPYLGVTDSKRSKAAWKKPGSLAKGDISGCTDRNSLSKYDPVYLRNAINGYTWLKKSGMKNDQGLYTDGFHIRGYSENHTKTECDERNEMLYTYNQGVILSGLRGIWEATGDVAFLEDGHELIRSVIHATGWTDTSIYPTPSMSNRGAKNSESDYMAPNDGSWAGLGAHGILTELCDPPGYCNQDGQTFKGIFFHHLTEFCASLPTTPVTPGKTHAASRLTASLHRASCDEYAPWVVKNAQAALNTRNERGLFGTWWGAGDAQASKMSLYSQLKRQNLEKEDLIDRRADEEISSYVQGQLEPAEEITVRETQKYDRPEERSDDPNDRGRGRTVETQGGGVAVTRAMWEFLRNYESGASGSL